MQIKNKHKKSRKVSPKTAQDKRYRRNEASLGRAIVQVLAQRRVGVRGVELCNHAKISSPTFYAHCRNSDDALNNYETSIIDDFLITMPAKCSSHETIFIILLNFVRQHHNYFAATLKNHNAWLLVQLIDTIRPNLVSNNISDKCYDLYTGSITTLIFCWYKHEGFAAEKIPLYTKKLLQIRVMDIGI